MNSTQYLSVLLLLGVFIFSGASQQENQLESTRTESKIPEVDFSKSTKLIRSLCLQDFNKESAELVYGMHGQSWIVDQLKIDSETPVFLSTGYSADGEWRAPDPALIKALSSKRIRSVNDADEGDILVVIENIDWKSENHVMLDISTYHKDFTGNIHGSCDVEFELKNGKWVISNQGGCQMRKIKER